MGNALYACPICGTVGKRNTFCEKCHWFLIGSLDAVSLTPIPESELAEINAAFQAYRAGWIHTKLQDPSATNNEILTLKARCSQLQDALEKAQAQKPAVSDDNSNALRAQVKQLQAQLAKVQEENARLTKELASLRPAAKKADISAPKSTPLQKIALARSMMQQAGIEIGATIAFGNHNKWKIIDIFPDSVLLICEDYDRYHCFHSEGKLATWSTCTLRKWLNDDFIKSNFETKDGSLLKYILDTNIKTQVNHKIFPDVSEFTTDKVFIFDEKELKTYKHLLSWDSQAWLLRSPSPKNGHGYVVTCEGNSPYLWGVTTDHRAHIKPVIRVSKDYFMLVNP